MPGTQMDVQNGVAVISLHNPPVNALHPSGMCDMPLDARCLGSRFRNQPASLPLQCCKASSTTFGRLKRGQTSKRS
jgi:hypothetical protein